MDYHPGQSGRVNLEAALSRLTDEVVLPAGGRFYLAKDSVLTPEQMHRSFGIDAVDSFLSLKRRLDPGEIFQSDMYRRLFAPFAAGV
jgi:FAD/FMN-containing dehydrogenase